jgi:hypothetical protein
MGEIALMTFERLGARKRRKKEEGFIAVVLAVKRERDLFAENEINNKDLSTAMAI